MCRILFTAALTLAALPSVAMAHAKLPLTFSEKLLAPLSGIDLTMTVMPGMADHAPMPIKGFRTAVDRDGKTLVVTLPRALPAGSYDLNWHIVGADQHKIAGKYSFSVK